jgi:predicted nucleic acid-binding Zn ribbon protein
MDEAVAHVMQRLGTADAHRLNVLAAEWAAVVGADVARHTRPGRLRGKELTVFVDSSAWLHELSRYGRGPMLAKLRARYGEACLSALRLEPDPDGPRR